MKELFKIIISIAIILVALFVIILIAKPGAAEGCTLSSNTSLKQIESVG